MDQKEKLYELVTRRGYRSIMQFAEDLGEGQGNVNKIMNGTKQPRVEKLLRYGSKLGLTPEEALRAFYPELMEKYYGQ